MKTYLRLTAILLSFLLLTFAACDNSDDSSDSPAVTYTVTYDGNGSTAGDVPADSTAYEKGDTITILGNTESLKKISYTFAGWNTSADGSGTTYTEDMTFSMGSKNITLYAIWKLAAWDGSADFRWYDEDNIQASYTITTPAQWAALAWICSEYLSIINTSDLTSIYGTVPTAQYTFEGVTIYLANDLDMGGVYDEDSDSWSGPNYYPVGCQGSADPSMVITSSTGTTTAVKNFYGLFYGSFNGQGHWVKNIYCNRGSGSNYQSCGLFGRIGAADHTAYPDVNITIKNVGVTGWIKSGRSVGGIVGKTLHVGSGYSITIENCVNKASISNTDSKGVAGICGAAWNGSTIKNCYNMGDIYCGYSNNSGGIAGSSEAALINCYNVGTVTQRSGTSAAIATQSSGSTIDNCYYLDGCADAGVYGTFTTEPVSKTESEIKDASFATSMGDHFIAVTGSYPVLFWEVGESEPEE